MNLTARILVVAVVVVSVIVGIWAGRTVLAPPMDPFDEPGPATYEVVEGSVGRSLPTTALAQWDLPVLAAAPTSGVVTSVDVTPGTEVDVGDVVASIDLRPVVIAEGEVPAFRDLGDGVIGADVTQLQLMLNTIGFDVGQSAVFDAETSAAVTEWQRSLGLEPDGVVRLGDVVFVESLPARVLTAPGVQRAAQVAPGTPLLLQVPRSPRWWLLVSSEQTSQIQPGTAVTVSIGDALVDGVVQAVVEVDGQGRFEAHITAADGSSICGADCVSVVPLDTEVHVFPAAVEVIAETTGPVIPVAALSSTADGRSVVTMDDGSDREVTVLTSSAGVAVVDGVRIGEMIMLPFDQ